MFIRLCSICFFIFLTIPVQAESYFLQSGAQRVKIEFFSIEKVLVNDFCKEKISQCKALSILKNPPAFPKKLNQGMLSSEAQAYCKYLKGVPLRLINEKEEQAPFCAFEDKTMISSWDLFNTHSQKAKK